MAIGSLTLRLTNRRLRWAGLISIVLLIMAYATSGKYVGQGGLTLDTGGIDSASLCISRGGVSFEFGRALREPSYDKLIWIGWRTHGSFGFDTRPRVWLSNVDGGLPDYGYLFIPFWIPLFIVAPSTAYLWWKERSPPPGLCRKCRYDLVGIAAAVCPECGTPILNGSEAARLRGRTGRVEAVLIGFVVGALAGWSARRFSFDGSVILHAIIAGMGAALVSGLFAGFIGAEARRFCARWSTRKG